jgi:hypothetical protein
MALPVARPSPLRAMFQLRFFRAVGVLSVLLWVALTVLPAVRVLPLIYGKKAVPLHYNIHVGVDSVGPWWQIFFVSALGLVMMLVNLALARYMWTRDPVLAYVTGFATVVLEALLFTAMIFIVYLSLSYA